MKTQPLNLKPSQLVLDPNNYRFYDLPTYKPVATRARYAESSVQDRALRLLQNTTSFELGPLKDSILTNGFVPIEQIVVELFSEGVPGETEALYLVIEGNRRISAIKTLLQEHAEGVIDIDSAILETFETISVTEILGTAAERKSYQQVLMAIRHVAGIREWGPYQQAKLVVELYEEGDSSFGSVAQRIGISSKEVARRYRASKALQQMEDDEEFGDYASPRLYTFFHEAVSQPKVREWLDFSDETYQARSEVARRTFYELLSPRLVDGRLVEPKLQSANSQVRQLKEIVDKALPLKILADPERSFEEAVSAAQDENVHVEEGLLEHCVARALNALREPPIDAWLSASPRAQELWTELSAFMGKVDTVFPK
ncbi:hypothetical protein [Stenotrophomonas maltophilia]